MDSVPTILCSSCDRMGGGYLVVSQSVESLPVVVYLGGDVLVLENDASHPALPPLCPTQERGSEAT